MNIFFFKKKVSHWMSSLIEWDVPYMNRISIDKNVRCGLWYQVENSKEPFYEIDKDATIGKDMKDKNTKRINYQLTSLTYIKEIEDKPSWRI